MPAYEKGGTPVGRRTGASGALRKKDAHQSFFFVLVVLHELNLAVLQQLEVSVFGSRKPIFS